MKTLSYFFLFKNELYKMCVEIFGSMKFTMKFSSGGFYMNQVELTFRIEVCLDF